MNQQFTLTAFFLFLCCFATMSYAQPLITQVIPLDTVVEQYEKFEVEVDLMAAYDNPYDFDQIRLSAVFTGPNSQQVTVDGFFKEDFLINSSGGLTPDGQGFKVRFSPMEVGTWTYEVSIEDSTGSHTFALLSFDCVVPSTSENKGFVRTNQTNYLQFDDGDPYILVGENMAWQNGNAFVDYNKWLGELGANGGNFFRLWHAHWGLGIEWKDGWRSFQGLKRYKELNGIYQDWLYDYCAENGIYVMLCLQHHGPVSTQVNPNWNDSPYNAANGGPCQNTWDFFTDPTAKDLTKNRYRYIVARWGYARSIMAWELFNEVEWTDNFSTHRQKVADWHREMAAYLQGIDPYGHIITTSYAHDTYDPAVWNDPNIDITQTHYYLNTPNIERVLAGGIQSYLTDFGKPTLNGEFGLGGSISVNTDPDGIHIHNCLWGGLFAGGIGTAMTWWWDTYVHPADLYYHFDPVSQMAGRVPFIQEAMYPVQGVVSGTSGDLSITPNQSWGIIGTPLITIDQNGLISPSTPGLAQYLYGSAWNTQFRSPPEFQIDLLSSGTFTVRTGTSSGTAPKIAIWLNGNKILDQSAQTNKSYSINVPAGPNTIKVDNTGTDWITISNYTFSGIGSTIDAYVLGTASQEVAAGWVINNEYNHDYVLANGTPPLASGGQLTLTDFKAGNYFVKWYDCLTGSIFRVDQVTVPDSVLSINIPDLIWDASFLVDDEAVAVGIADHGSEYRSLEVFPNPATAGSRIQLGFSLPTSSQVAVSLLDLTGRNIGTLSNDFLAQGNQQLGVALPTELAEGLYWVKVAMDHGIMTEAVVVR